MKSSKAASLLPTTVMSWRGEEGGIAAANMGHEAIMTPGSGGMYIDQFQGDPKIEPVSIGGYDPLSRVYAYKSDTRYLGYYRKGKLDQGGTNKSVVRIYVQYRPAGIPRLPDVCWHWLK